MRRLSRLLLLALLALVAGVYPLLAPTAHRIDRAHYERVKNDILCMIEESNRAAMRTMTLEQRRLFERPEDEG